MASKLKLSPSAASRWMNCPASVAMSAKVPPSPTSVYAAEGTAAAFLAEFCLKGGEDAKEYKEFLINVQEDPEEIGRSITEFGPEGVTGGYEFEVDAEMIDAVQIYLDTVRAEHSKGSQLLVEQKVEITCIHEEAEGTPDAAVVVPWGKLTVIDFKYGKGVVVEVEENYQLLTYLAGVERASKEVFTEMEVVIVQPRAPHADGPVRRWTVTRPRLDEFIQEAHNKALVALDDNAPFEAGGWCRWCAVNGQCPEQAREAKIMAKTDFEEVGQEIQSPDLMPVAQIAALYGYRKQMENWFKAMGEILREKLNTGEEVPGWKLVAGAGNRQWVDEIDAEKKLRAHRLRKKDIVTHPKPKLLSPAKIEKLKGGSFNTKTGLKELVNTLTERPEREPSLVPEEDKRLELRPAKAEFEDLTGESNGSNDGES